MQFNSYEFSLFFLPLTIIFYFLANKLTPLLGKIVIIVSSLIFYSVRNSNMLIYLGISIFINYFSAIAIQKTRIKSKWVIAFPLITNIGLLFYFKYLNFAIININSFFNQKIELQTIILPLGISFYTFQQIAYIVAAERKEFENNSAIDYLTYILFFPKLIMGPITDPVDFMSQLNQEQRKKININNIAIGIKIYSLGLIKKALLANVFSKAVSWTYTNLEIATAMDCILLMLCYTFEIYFDFSGYSDMAVGASSMLNIDLPINFDSPYKALSIRDFWKRWHISLSKFFTKYIYIPLGGSKKGILFTCINTLTVFFISGLWHGANWTFILWGFLHGMFCCFDRLFDRLESKVFTPIRWMCTLGIVNVLWLLFSAESISQWKLILSKILFLQNTTISEDLLLTFNLVENQFIYNILRLDFLSTNIRGFNMIIFILVACIICFIPQNNYRSKDSLGIGSLLLSAFVFVWGILCLGSESVFVYFGF